jgi:Polysaccharide pyruvyl transferase
VRSLVAGWFSFEQMGASAGDLIARDVVCSCLRAAGRAYDVALAAPFEGGETWSSADPAEYSEVIFVCGPFGNGPPLTEFLERFADRPLVGINLSLLEPLHVWNPFDLLLERDSDLTARPDLAFLGGDATVPTAGLVLIGSQPEYGERARHLQAHEVVRRVLGKREIATVEIDTRLDDRNRVGLRTPREVEALIARMDVVITTRLHGMVLALKNGVPAVAIDSVAGGAKVNRQAEALGWPAALEVNGLIDSELERALDWCLTEEARTEARRCRAQARQHLRVVLDELSSFLAESGRSA